MKNPKRRIWRIALGLGLVAAFVALAWNVMVGPSQTEDIAVQADVDAAQTGEIDSASPLSALMAGDVVGRRGRNRGPRVPVSPAIP